MPRRGGAHEHGGVKLKRLVNSSSTVPQPFHNRSTTVPQPFYNRPSKRSTTVPPPYQNHSSKHSTKLKPLLKAHAFSASNRSKLDCFQVLLSISSCAPTT
jgi:hypothetical protein